MGEERLLRPEPMERALRTAEVFASFCQAAGIDDVVAVGTSAIRDAANQAELLGQIRERTGLEVRVLTEEEEARYAYLAMVNSTTLTDGFGVDLGGGSMQLIRDRGDRRRVDLVSMPLGAVRASEAFLPDDEASGRSRSRQLRAHGHRAARGASSGSGSGGRLVGVGGDPRPYLSGKAHEAFMFEAQVRSLPLTLCSSRTSIRAWPPPFCSQERKRRTSRSLEPPNSTCGGKVICLIFCADVSAKTSQGQARCRSAPEGGAEEIKQRNFARSYLWALL